MVKRFFERIREQAREKRLLSDEHFSVDGTLIEAWTSQKSLKRIDIDPKVRWGRGRISEVAFRDKPRRNETHESGSDADVRLEDSRGRGALELHGARADRESQRACGDAKPDRV